MVQYSIWIEIPGVLEYLSDPEARMHLHLTFCDGYLDKNQGHIFVIKFNRSSWSLFSWVEVPMIYNQLIKNFHRLQYII